MAWGVMEPYGLGQYYLECDLPGWDEKIRDYYINEMSDDEKRRLGMEDGLHYSRFASKYDGRMGPLEDYALPSDVQTVRGFKELPSMVTLGSLFLVDEPLKAIIEAIEPNKPQFWPMKITMPKGKEYPVPYYGMIILQSRDSFLPEQSEYQTYLPETDRYRGGDQKGIE